MNSKPDLQPLRPSVKSGGWRDHNDEAIDQAYVDVRRAVLQRDTYTCQYCGFRSVPTPGQSPVTNLASGYLQVHHVNDDHTDNRLENLVTVCPFCHQVFHVGNAGYNGNAVAIYLPDLTQQQLNLLVNSLAVAAAREPKDATNPRVKTGATRLYNTLRRLDKPLDDAVEIENTPISDLKNLAGSLMLLKGENTDLVLANVRVLPNIDSFRESVLYWSDRTWLAGPNWEEEWRQIHKTWKNEENNG